MTLLAGGHERSLYGCIISFENDRGQRLVLHRPGPPMKGFRQACAIALAHDESFRVISYSTPDTVHSDLVGRVIHQGNTTPALPELQIGARLGLRDMLHRRLLDASDGHRPERHVRRRAAQRRARGESQMAAA